jgi:hypothetical protein
VTKWSPGFVLFVVIVGVLFVRPTELIDGLQDAPLYEMTIRCSLVLSAPAVLAQLRPDALRARRLASASSVCCPRSPCRT